MENEIIHNPDIKVSVIMPIYNAGEYLHRAISDVLGQSLREIELICIDDGSTDNSLKIIKEFQEQDERVRIVTENNAGPSIARNKGIVRARGEYIIFLDADDFYEPSLLANLYETATRDSLDIAVTRFDIYNESQDKFIAPTDEPHSHIFAPGIVTSKSQYPDQILQSTTGYVWNKLFRTSFIRDKELSFDPDLYVFEDVHFVCSAISLAERVARVDNVLIHHRVYSEQSRAKLFRKYYSQVPVVYRKIKEFLMRHGMYIPLSKAYLNLSAGRCYKIYNLLWSEGKESFWSMLHTEFAEEFGWFKHEKADYESLEVYEFICNVGLYTHAEYLDRVDKEKIIDVENMDTEKLVKLMKDKQNSEKFMDAMNKIFKIKPIDEE